MTYISIVIMSNLINRYSHITYGVSLHFLSKFAQKGKCKQIISFVFYYIYLIYYCSLNGLRLKKVIFMLIKRWTRTPWLQTNFWQFSLWLSCKKRERKNRKQNTLHEYTVSNWVFFSSLWILLKLIGYQIK